MRRLGMLCVALLLCQVASFAILVNGASAHSNPDHWRCHRHYCPPPFPSPPRGPQGPTKSVGTTVPQEYGYIYNASDQIIPIGGSLSYEANGVMTAGITHAPGSPNVTVINAGVYKIDFSIQTAQPSQFTIYDNGVAVPNTTFGAFGGSQLTHGESVIPLAAGDVISIVNDTSLYEVQLQDNPGGVKSAINALLYIQRIN